MPPSNDDATGRFQDDEWSLASFDVRSYDSLSFDVRSMASEDDDAFSQASSSRSRISATETFGDHLFESDTAFTAGSTVPLAALPPGVLLPRHTTIADDQSSDALSLRSVNTRRGWPRVQPGQHVPQPPELPPRGSYLDALLRDPSETPPAPPQQQARTGGSVRAASSGWVMLPKKSRGARLRARLRGPEIPLSPLEEEDVNEEQEPAREQEPSSWPHGGSSPRQRAGPQAQHQQEQRHEAMARRQEEEFEFVAVP